MASNSDLFVLAALQTAVGFSINNFFSTLTGDDTESRKKSKWNWTNANLYLSGEEATLVTPTALQWDQSANLGLDLFKQNPPPHRKSNLPARLRLLSLSVSALLLQNIKNMSNNFQSVGQLLDLRRIMEKKRSGLNSRSSPVYFSPSEWDESFYQVFCKTSIVPCHTLDECLFPRLNPNEPTSHWKRDLLPHKRCFILN